METELRNCEKVLADNEREWNHKMVHKKEKSGVWKDKIKKLEAMHFNDAPIERILSKISSKKDSLSWYGVTNFSEFYIQVFSFLKPYKGWPNQYRKLQRTLITLRNGFSSRLAIPLMEPKRSHQSFQRVLLHTVRTLFQWAKKQIYLPCEEDWALLQPSHFQSLFPGVLFFFLDGTVIEIWSPSDLKKYRASYNSKHNLCAFSFFVMVTGNGFITYVSLIDTGNTHDSTSWNTAMAWPPLNENGQERDDGFKLTEQLEAFYGCGKSEDFALIEEGKKHTFALSGDKAYPLIKLPKGWSLYVTMTAGEEDALREAKGGNAATASILNSTNQPVPKFTHNISDDPMRHKDPQIARARSVVERVIGAIKDWKILGNIPFVSQQKFHTLFQMIVLFCAICNYTLKEHGTAW